MDGAGKYNYMLTAMYRSGRLFVVNKLLSYRDLAVLRTLVIVTYIVFLALN